jgi:hypothetical protein
MRNKVTGYRKQETADQDFRRPRSTLWRKTPAGRNIYRRETPIRNGAPEGRCLFKMP